VSSPPFSSKDSGGSKDRACPTKPRRFIAENEIAPESVAHLSTRKDNLSQFNILRYLRRCLSGFWIGRIVVPGDARPAPEDSADLPAGLIRNEHS
jgi:hypothetical protein